MCLSLARWLCLRLLFLCEQKTQQEDNREKGEREVLLCRSYITLFIFNLYPRLAQSLLVYITHRVST